jgi:hypothetical protein
MTLDSSQMWMHAQMKLVRWFAFVFHARFMYEPVNVNSVETV